MTTGMMIALAHLAALALSAATSGLPVTGVLPAARAFSAPAPVGSSSAAVRTALASHASATVIIVHAARIGARYADELVAANAQPRVAVAAGSDGRLDPVQFYDFQ